MTLSREERAEAHEELPQQARFYEREHAGPGLDFLDAVDVAIEAIVGFPDAWRPYPGWDRQPVLRVKQVQGFPVGVVYFVDGAQLVILAYAHHQRDFGYWSARFGEAVARDWADDETMSAEETLRRFEALNPEPTPGPRKGQHLSSR